MSGISYQYHYMAKFPSTGCFGDTYLVEELANFYNPRDMWHGFLHEQGKFWALTSLESRCLHDVAEPLYKTNLSLTIFVVDSSLLDLWSLPVTYPPTVCLPCLLGVRLDSGFVWVFGSVDFWHHEKSTDIGAPHLHQDHSHTQTLRWNVSSWIFSGRYVVTGNPLACHPCPPERHNGVAENLETHLMYSDGTVKHYVICVCLRNSLRKKIPHPHAKKKYFIVFLYICCVNCE